MQMHKGMGGPHLFEVTINSNDPSPAVSRVSVRANYLERGEATDTPMPE